MHTEKLAQYRCPLCQQALLLDEKSYRCANNHSFDQAKQGYVNLLPVQFKHSKEPGDNKAMVQARRAFLDKGYYQPLLDSMLALYQKYGDTTLASPTIPESSTATMTAPEASSIHSSIISGT